MNRRDFFKNAAAVAAASQLNAQTRPPASDRVTVGIIGTGNQGTNDMMGVLRDERVQVVAVCDVNRGSAGYWDGIYAGREPAKAVVEWIYAQDARSGRYKGCDGLRGLPRAPGAQGHRRGADRRARSLARHHGDRGR